MEVEGHLAELIRAEAAGGEWRVDGGAREEREGEREWEENGEVEREASGGINPRGNSTGEDGEEGGRGAGWGGGKKTPAGVVPSWRDAYCGWRHRPRKHCALAELP